MPWGDRTGPRGRGELTGRRLGYCRGYRTPGYTKGLGPGRGFRRGLGARRGYRLEESSYFPEEDLTKEEEKELLEQEKKAIEKELKQLED